MNTTANGERINGAFASPEWYLRGFAANIRVRAETVAEETAGCDFDAVLDIGCGDGSVSAPLRERTRRMTFLDPSAAMLEHVARRMGVRQSDEIPKDSAANDITFVHSDFLSADLPEGEFDLVVCLGVLAYVPDLDQFFERLDWVLARRGRLLIECTEAGHPLSRLELGYQRLTGLIRPSRLKTYPHGEAEVVATAQAWGLRHRRTFRYAYSVPVLSKFLSPPGAYALIRRIFGTPANNRRPHLGNQRILSFERP